MANSPKNEINDIEIDNSLQDYLKEIDNVLESESNFCKEHKVNEVKLTPVTPSSSSNDVITEVTQEFDETSQNEPPPPTESTISTVKISSHIEQSLKSSSCDIKSVINEYQNLIENLSLDTTDQNLNDISQQYNDRLTEITNNLMLLYNKNSNIQFHYFQTLSVLSTLKSKLIDYVKKIEIFQNEFKTMKGKYETKISQYESILNNYQTYINDINVEKDKLSEENEKLSKEIEDKEDEIEDIKFQSKKELEEYKMKKILELNELKSKYENQIKNIEESTKEIIDNLHKKLNELVIINSNEESELSVDKNIVENTESSIKRDDDEEDDDVDDDEENETIKRKRKVEEEEEKVEEELLTNMKGDLTSDEGSFVDSFTQSKNRTGSLLSKLQLIV